MAVRTWTLKIRGDSTDALEAAAKVERRYKGLGDGINRGLSDSLGKSESRFSQFGSKVASSGARFGRAFGVALAGGVAAVAAGLVSALEAASESIKVGRQTEQVLKTMGATSWTSAGKVGDLSTRLSNMSGVDDELIQQGANLVLTFKNIRNAAGTGNDVFDRTVAVANDMSVALGQDMSSSSIQLGKALNDPIKGVTALQRVGVSFTQGQRDQIRTLVESGRTLDAQKLILKEVESQFGGTAEAVALPWDKLKVSLGNVVEEIGAKLFPAAEAIVNWFADKIPKAIDFATQIWDAFTGGFKNPGVDSGTGIFRVVQEMGQIAAEVWPHIQSLAGSIGDLAGKVRDFFSDNPAVAFAILGTVLGVVLLPVVAALVGALTALLSPFILVAAGVAAVAAAVAYAWTHWEGFRNVVMAVVDWFKATAWPALQNFAELVMEKFGQMADWVKKIWPQVQEAVSHVIKVIGVVIGVFVTVATALWDRFGSTILDFAKGAWNSIRAVIEAVINVIRGIIETVLAVINGDWGKAWDGIKRILSGVWQAMRAIVGNAVNAIQLVIGLAWQAILAVTGFIWRAIPTVITAVWTAIKAVVAAALWWLQLKISIAWNVIKAVTGFVWDVISTVITGVWTGIKAVIAGALWVIQLVISTVWNTIKGVTKFIWDGISTVVSGVWDGIKSSVGAAVTWVHDRIKAVLGNITGIWSKVWGGMKDVLGGIWDGIKGAVTSGINAVIGVINFFIRLINKIPGVPDIGELKTLSSGGGAKPSTVRSPRRPPMAAGGFLTNQGGRGAEYVVGEGNRFHPEAVIATDPRYRRRNQALVAWAAEKLGMSVAPGYQLGGIVDAVTGPFRGAANLVSGFLDDIRSATLRPIFNAAKGMVDALPIPRDMWGPELKGFGKDVLERMYRWASGKADESAAQPKAGGGPGGNAGYRGGGVERWRSTALQALQLAGAPASWIGSLLRRMNQESGGNPRAINNWDSNARRGDPSRGLMQTIGSTFAAYAGPYASRGIYDPLANIYAAIKYTIARYGSGPAGWDRAGGYARGGILGFRNGGRLNEDVIGVGARTGRRHLMHAGEQITAARDAGGPRTVINIDRLAVGGDTPTDVRRNAHIFMDVIERRQIEHEARGA